MPDWIAVVLLGVIEGVTEFLPVSSTGHLLLAERWLPAQSDLFNTVIQCGALLAVFVVFWRRAVQLLTGWRDPAQRDFLLKLGAAFLITALGGLIAKKLGFKLPKTAGPVAWATLVGGVLILLVERWLGGKRSHDTISWGMAVAIGVAQLVAGIFPGTSRSGATILMGVALGMGRPAAAEFSFLLGLPTLFAASALELLLSFKRGDAAHENWGLVLLGCVVAAVSAFAVVKWLLRYVQTHSFVPFGWYRIALGAAILLLAGS